MRRPPPRDIAPPAAGLRRYRMVVAYHGAAFHGVAPNPGIATVAGTLASSMRRVLGHEPSLVIAGRTDAGVHAWGQVLSFDAPPLDVETLQHSLNSMCAPSIVVRAIDPAPDDFDARFSAQQRTYRYRVLARPLPDPFAPGLSWHVPDPLDLDAMNAAAAQFVGTHDFTSFCRRRVVTVDGAEIVASAERTVVAAHWEAIRVEHTTDELVELWISATAFCHQMVRSLAGTMVDIGLGRRRADEVPAMLAARRRAAAGRVAPPHGLTLWSVTYPGRFHA